VLADSISLSVERVASAILRSSREPAIVHALTMSRHFLSSLITVALDPDAQVRETIAHFFDTFVRVSSAHQTVRACQSEGSACHESAPSSSLLAMTGRRLNGRRRR
jgi:hypothetical protein